MSLKLLTVCVAGVLIAADTPKGDEAAKKEMEKFAGTWTLVEAERDGEKVPADQLKDIRLTVEGNKRTVKNGDQVVMESTFTVDPSKSPKQIDITATGGPLQGQKLAGIYEIDGDTMKVCLALGGERPKEMKGGEGRLFQVVKRAKK